MEISRREFVVRGIGAMCLLAPSILLSGARAEGQLRAEVNRKRCNGCETCVDTCPEVFAISGEKAMVKLDPIPPELEGCALAARDECMAGAIKILR